MRPVHWFFHEWLHGGFHYFVTIIVIGMLLSWIGLAVSGVEWVVRRRRNRG